MRQSREACDRCHSMKNRCVRTEHSQICQRCERLGISCNYSPPGRTGRPRSGKKARALSSDTTKIEALSQIVVQFPSPPSVTTSNDIFRNSISMEALHSNPGEFDLLSEQFYSISDNSTSSARDGLLADSMHDPVFSTPDPFTTQNWAHSTQSLLDGESSIQVAPASVCASLPEEVSRPSDPKNIVNRLLEIQPRLLRLIMRFSDQTNTTEDAEDIYRVTQNLVSIIASMEEAPSGLSPGVGFEFSGVAVLLVSSCYFSLVQTYQYLVDILAKEANASTSLQAISHVAGSSLSCLQEPNVPTISIGGLRLAMPGKAAAEVNLYLIAQTVQYLRGALDECAKRMGSPRRDSSQSCPDGMGPEILDDSETMKRMVCQAVDHLNIGEERLLDNLHTLVGASNDRIFNIK